MTILAAALVPTLAALALLALVKVDANHPLAQTFLRVASVPAPHLAVAAVVLVSYLPWITILAVLIDRDRRTPQPQVMAPVYRMNPRP